MKKIPAIFVMMKFRQKNKDVVGEILLFFFFVFVLCHFKPLSTVSPENPETRKELKVGNLGSWVLSTNETERGSIKKLLCRPLLLPDCERSPSSFSDAGLECLTVSRINYDRIRALLQYRYYKQ